MNNRTHSITHSNIEREYSLDIDDDATYQDKYATHDVKDLHQRKMPYIDKDLHQRKKKEGGPSTCSTIALILMLMMTFDE